MRLFLFNRILFSPRYTHRRMRGAAAFASLTLLFLCSAPGASATSTAPSLRVSGCGVAVWGYGGPDDTTAWMFIRFENLSDEVITSITWRVTTEAGTLDFVDVGRFEPHVAILHRLKRIHKLAPRISLEENGRSCGAIRTVTKSGNVWTDAEAGPATFYVPPVPQDTNVTIPASLHNPAHNPIGIVSCEFTILPQILTKPPRAYGHVYFRNLSSQAIKHITFRAFFGSAGMDFQEDGTFSPNVLVNTGDMTRYDLPANAFREYLDLDSPLSCTTVGATYADGTIWQNPSVGPTEPPFPEPLPSTSP